MEWRKTLTCHAGLTSAELRIWSSSSTPPPSHRRSTNRNTNGRYRTSVASVGGAALYARVSQLREDDKTPMASMFDAAPHRRVSRVRSGYTLVALCEASSTGRPTLPAVYYAKHPHEVAYTYSRLLVCRTTRRMALGCGKETCGVPSTVCSGCVDLAVLETAAARDACRDRRLRV